MNTTATLAYKVLGTTNEVTDCDLCGRSELKGTVRLVALDADGNPEGDELHYGSDCGARASGWTSKDITAAARTADDEAHAARLAAQNKKNADDMKEMEAWLAAKYGPGGRDDIYTRTGISPYAQFKEWRASKS